MANVCNRSRRVFGAVLKIKSMTQNRAERRRATERKEAGFTLAEFVAGTAVTLIMMTMGMSLLNQGQKLFSNQSASLQAQARARKALNLMVTDIGMAGCAPVSITSGNTPGLLSATATSIRVIADRDSSGTTSNSTGDLNDDVTYSFSGGVITRLATNDPAYQSGGVAQAVPVIDNVSSLTLSYFDSNGNALAAPLSAANLAKVTRIQLSIVANVRELGQTTGTVTVDTPIVLRNRKLGAY